MWNDCSITRSPQAAAGLALQAVWSVKADDSYDVRPRPSDGRSGLVVLRTLAGQGALESDDFGPLTVEADTLLLFDHPRLRRYRCLGGRWDFWWFECFVEGELGVPLDRVLRVTAHQRDVEDVSDCMALLRKTGRSSRRCASAYLSLMLHRWVDRQRQDGKPQPHQRAIARVIEKMHADLSGRVGLREWAEAAGLGERRFRQVFLQTTGKTPKRYYDDLRLGMAVEFLRMGHSVSQTAGKLGFSSPFHFSSAFSRRFGAPPSRYGR